MIEKAEKCIKISPFMEVFKNDEKYIQKFLMEEQHNCMWWK